MSRLTPLCAGHSLSSHYLHFLSQQSRLLVKSSLTSSMYVLHYVVVLSMCHSYNNMIFSCITQSFFNESSLWIVDGKSNCVKKLIVFVGKAAQQLIAKLFRPCWNGNKTLLLARIFHYLCHKVIYKKTKLLLIMLPCLLLGGVAKIVAD